MCLDGSCYRRLTPFASKSPLLQPETLCRKKTLVVFVPRGTPMSSPSQNVAGRVWTATTASMTSACT